MSIKRYALSLDECRYGPTVFQAILLVQKPFKCQITPRSEGRAKMIQAQFEAAKGTFQQFEGRIISLTEE